MANLSLGVATYIWIDRNSRICSKTKTISVAKGNDETVPVLNRWKMTDHVHVEELEDETDKDWKERHDEMQIRRKTFILCPCNYIPDPLSPQPSFLVLCEVRGLDDIPDPWCARARLRKYLEKKDLMPGEEPEATPAGELDTWWGIKQSFSLSNIDNEKPLRQKIKRDFLHTSIDAGLLIHSVTENNYWLGPRNIPEDIDHEKPSPLIIADHLIFSRFLLNRLDDRGILKKGSRESCSFYLSTESSREDSSKMNDLMQSLQGILTDSPNRTHIPVKTKQGEQYRECVSKSRPSIYWTPTLSNGISVSTQDLNYVRLDGLPSNVDPYEAMHRILQVIVKSDSPQP